MFLFLVPPMFQSKFKSVNNSTSIISVGIFLSLLTWQSCPKRDFSSCEMSDLNNENQNDDVSKNIIGVKHTHFKNYRIRMLISLIIELTYIVQSKVDI